MPSSRRRARGSDQLPIYSETIFTDRNLGTKIAPELLRASGLTVVTMTDYYGVEAAAAKADTVWIADIGQEGWVVFHKDAKIRYRTLERAAVDRYRVRMFCLTNGNIPGTTIAQWYANNLHNISRASQRPGPYIYGVYESVISRLHPSD